MVCQRCKSNPASSGSQQKCLTDKPGVYTVREIRLCSACRGQDWPTMDVDAPWVTVVETVESTWKEMAETREQMGSLENFPADKRIHLQRMFKMMAIQLLSVSEQSAAELPAEAAAFVREQLGEPPYPTALDVMLQDPEFRENYESQFKR